MNIILLSKRGKPRTLSLPRHWPALAVAVLVVLPMVAGVGAYWISYKVAPPAYTSAMADRFQAKLDRQARQIEKLQSLGENQFRALTLKLAEAEARLVRLDALGSRLLDVADIDSGEFDFTSEPALGGPESAEGEAYQPPSYLTELNRLNRALKERQQQLNILEDLLADRKLEHDTFLAGRPVHQGWMSSRFGRRVDPFSGKVSFHPGVDFAARKGTKIVATASGVVTWAGPRYGYGNLVQISHGNGISTRYGHAEKVLVKLGDIVRTGDVIALVGSTGRSTGPHVHYEVLKNGHPVDPQPYIARARK